MTPRAKTTALLTLLIGLAGCGGGEREEKTPIPMGQLPAPVVKAAQQRLPDVAFDAAFREKYNGEAVYELRGKDKKWKTREVEISQQGKVVKVE